VRRTRIAALLVAAPLAFAPAASADPTVPGCWGAASATYCNATLRISAGQTGSNPTPVCAGSCIYVGVPTVNPRQGTYQACIDYSTPSGYPASDCYVDVDMDDTVDTVGLVAQAVVCRVNPKNPNC
jgi:hypothetical protein